MFFIPCPNCGPRDEYEFSYGGEAHISRPSHDNAERMTDQEWANYLFYRSNTKGVFRERWVHSAGCRKWFNVARDTVTNDIKHIYPIGEKPPEIPNSKLTNKTPRPKSR